MKVVVFVLFFSGLISLSQGCFPSKYWISCRIDTCKLGGSCPGDPTAICRMDTTECNGCKATWYTTTGEKANCSAVKDLALCPGGEPIVHCKMDPCQWSCDHPLYRNAECRKNYCGRCEAEYKIDGKWGPCPSTDPSNAGSMLPIDTVLNPETVTGECTVVPCNIGRCIGHKCPAVPNAVCRPYSCNVCEPMWYLDNIPVDCKTGDFIRNLPKPPKHQPIVTPLGGNQAPIYRSCKPGESYVSCPQSVCDGQICRNHPNAVCRADGCGKCKPTWYLDNILVNCLSDQCAPNVPVVKCVDDPCKYFSHYCPTAECRASECGKCEAKFYVDGNEIDCVMPPKVCPTGSDALTCPFFTCPANICPSNTRLMCRIDPCGNECRHEWIDIYNGETRSCRTFDGGKSNKGKSKYKKPEMTKIFFKDPIHSILDPNPTIEPIYVDKKQAESKLRFREIEATKIPPETNPSVNSITPMGEFVQKDQGGFKVQPLFVNPGPPIQDTDVLALLRSFNHEFERISSDTIRNALKKPIPKINPQSNIASPPMSQSVLQPMPPQTFVPMNQGPVPKPVVNKEIRPMPVKTSMPFDSGPLNLDSGIINTKTPMSTGNVVKKPAAQSQFIPIESHNLPFQNQALTADSQLFPGSKPTVPDLPVNSAQIPVDMFPSGIVESIAPGSSGSAQFPGTLDTLTSMDSLPPTQGTLMLPLDASQLPADMLPTTSDSIPAGAKASPQKVIELKHNSPTPDTSMPSQPGLPDQAPDVLAQLSNQASQNSLQDQAAALLAQLSNQAMAANIDISQLLATVGATQGADQLQPAPGPTVEQPLYPEMNLIPGANSNIQPVGQNQGGLVAQANAPKVAVPSNQQPAIPVNENQGGLPISMTLFDQWG